MSILKTLTDIVLSPGWIASSAVDEVTHGGIINHASIGLSGDAFHAVTCLKEHGVDAFSPSGGERDVSWLEVHKGNKKIAMKILRDLGYECW